MDENGFFWSCAELTFNYPREVVGFDIRRPTALGRLHMGIVYGWNETYEELLVELVRDYPNLTNGMNLFEIHPLKIPELVLPNDAIVIAFDLPVSLITEVNKVIVSPAFPLPEPAAIDGWIFAGYDVVDQRTQTSALFGFNPLPPSLIDALANPGTAFSGFGLIESEAAAIEFGSVCDSVIPEHGPFAPSGVWLQSNPNR